jgi:hypothetical protein
MPVFQQYGIALFVRMLGGRCAHGVVTSATDKLVLPEMP